MFWPSHLLFVSCVGAPNLISYEQRTDCHMIYLAIKFIIGILCWCLIVFSLREYKAGWSPLAPHKKLQLVVMGLRPITKRYVG